jgi:polyphosphate kinase 2 (PPK2 family)
MKKEKANEKLRQLYVELVKLQKEIIASRLKLLIILEGRDAAGKDGTIKAITMHLSPRETRVVALSKPSDREVGEWYFQRYSVHLPASGEWVLFNRSWYNRAGVETVALISHLLTRLEYHDRDEKVLTYKGELVYPATPENIKDKLFH